VLGDIVAIEAGNHTSSAYCGKLLVDAGATVFRLDGLPSGPVHDGREGHSDSYAAATTARRTTRQAGRRTAGRAGACELGCAYYVTPTEDNVYQTEKMKSRGIFRDVNQEVGEIIVADVNHQRIDELLAPDREALGRLIRKED
jgi:hypothetical protein